MPQVSTSPPQVFNIGYVNPDGSPSTPRPSQAKFHDLLDADIRCLCLLGGWGSGKSATGRNEALKRALLCAGSDGLIVRRTYNELTDSTWPECLASFGPLIHKVEKEEMTITLRNGSRLRFRSARHEGREDPTKFGSIPYAWFWMEEAADMDYQTWAYLKGRMRQAGFQQHGYRAWMTTNPPDTQHWIYREFVTKSYPDHALLRAPTQENRSALPDGYIERLEAQYDPSWVRRYLLGDFGFVATEWPVFPEYRESLHVAQAPLGMLPGRPMIRGWDFGVAYASCVTLQLTPTGHLNGMAVFMGRNTGIEEFGQSVLTQCAARGWQGPCDDYGDPAGWFRDASATRPVDYLRKLGILMLPGEQDVKTRLEGVRWALSTLRDGRPILQLDPGEDTRMLRDGFAGGYHWRERTEGQVKRPAKNEYSHPMDALQYALSRLRGRVTGRATVAPIRPRRVLGDWVGVST